MCINHEGILRQGYVMFWHFTEPLRHKPLGVEGLHVYKDDEEKVREHEDGV